LYKKYHLRQKQTKKKLPLLLLLLETSMILRGGKKRDADFKHLTICLWSCWRTSSGDSLFILKSHNLEKC